MRFLITISILIFTFCQGLAQSWDNAQKIVASDRMEEDYFGYGVHISKNFAIVGAYQEDHDVSGENELDCSGSAYIFEKDEFGIWNEVQKIVSSDRNIDDRFGAHVIIDDQFAFVGASKEDEDELGENYLESAGSVYVFCRDKQGVWVETQKIVSPERSEREFFGNSIAFEGGWLFVGVEHEAMDENGENYVLEAGAAYIYKRNALGIWENVQKVVSSDRSSGDFFGNSISISGNTAFIGAEFEDEDENGENTILTAGSVYIFELDEKDRWIEVQKIVSSERSKEDEFGWEVSVHNDYAIISTPLEDHNEEGDNFMNRSGAAYIFERDELGIWNEVQKLVASDRSAEDNFGWSASVYGDYAVIGAALEDHNEFGEEFKDYAGSAYLFKRNNSGTWVEVQKIIAPDRAAKDFFGREVFLNHNTSIIGAHLENENALGSITKPQAGSAYLYKVSRISAAQETNLDLEIFSYPNPTTGDLTIEFGDINHHLNACIYNIMGEKQYCKDFEPSNRINIEIEGHRGVYIVHLQTLNGQRATFKVTKL